MVVTLETGSNYPFELRAVLDTGSPWDLTGAAVTLTFRRPDGTRFTRLAAVTDGPGGVARYVSTTAELDVPGYWCRQWTVTDALGTTENGAPVWFNVEAALPVTPSAAPAADVFVLATRRVNAGTGLAGGGTLAADVTLSLPAVGTPGTYGDATHYPVITTDAQGRVTAVSVQLGGGGAGVGSFNTRTGVVTLTTADVTGVLGYTPVAPTRQVLAGAGLSGGGDLSADRTLSLPNVGPGAGAYGDATHFPALTLDAQGRVAGVALQVVGGSDLNVLSYGAVPDGRTVADAAVTSGATALTSATAGFTAADVGKPACLALVRTVTDAAITTGTATLTSATAAFTAADVGKRVIIPAAVGGTYLDTTILSVTNATTAVLAANASSTVSGVQANIVATHNTTVAAYVSATQVTLAAAAPFTFSGASLRWGTDNRAAFATALAAAATTGKTLTIPSGVFFLNYTSGNPKLSANADYRVVGAGADRTVLLIGPEQASFRIQVFEAFAHRKVEISDLTVQGPVTFGSDYTSTPFQVSAPTAGTGYTRLLGTTVTGGLCTAFNADAGVAGVTHTLEVDRADWTCGYQVLASYFASANDDNLRRVHCSNCYFHAVWEHVWYIHPHVPTHMEDCRFESWGQNATVTSYALHFNGGGTTTPLYQEFSGCSFQVAGSPSINPRNGGACFCSNKGLNTFVGCQFKCGSFGKFRNKAIIQGCTFVYDSTQASGGTVIGQQAGANDFAQIIGCQFDAALACTLIDASGSGAKYYISGCDLRTSVAGVICINVGAGATAQVLFNRAVNSAASGTGTFAFVMGATATAEVRGLRLEGPWDTGGPFSLSATGVTLLSLSDCDFSGMTTTVPWKLTSANNTDKVVHSRNRYGATNYPRASAGTDNYATLIHGVGAALASAATVAPDVDSDTHHVTGTTTITAINLKADAQCNAVFGGAVLKLIADGAWALATGGNVKPKASGVAKAVDSVTTLLYDAAAGFWYEV